MFSVLDSSLHRAQAFIQNHRVALRTLVLIAAVITTADAFVFERGIAHALVGHTLVAIGLLALLILVEIPEGQEESSSLLTWPERQSANEPLDPLRH